MKGPADGATAADVAEDRAVSAQLKESQPTSVNSNASLNGRRNEDRRGDAAATSHGADQSIDRQTKYSFIQSSGSRKTTVDFA